MAKSSRRSRISIKAFRPRSERSRHLAAKSKDCGIDAETFNELAAPIEQKAVAPWLKKFNENGAEVVKTIRMDANGKTGTWQHASQEEIANGIHAATFEEFQAKKVA